MMLDKQNLFSDAQALALGAGATALSTNTLDMGAAGIVALNGQAAPYDIGKGETMDLLVQVVTDFTSGGAGTLEAELVMADDAALSSGLTVLVASGDIALASLKAGYQFRLSSVPPGVTKRYLGMRYRNDSGAALTAGAVTAGLVVDKSTGYVG